MVGPRPSSAASRGDPEPRVVGPASPARPQLAPLTCCAHTALFCADPSSCASPGLARAAALRPHAAGSLSSSLFRRPPSDRRVLSAPAVTVLLALLLILFVHWLLVSVSEASCVKAGTSSFVFTAVLHPAACPELSKP